MPTTKTGEKVSWKEFFKRWKKGIEEITPEQQIKTQLNGTKISIAGIFAGIVVSFVYYDKFWWVGLILIGALINSIVQYIGLLQKKKLFDSFNISLEQNPEFQVSQKVLTTMIGDGKKDLLVDSDIDVRRLEDDKS